jgi:hypothetical protein
MNGLEHYLDFTGIPMVEAMNFLQEHGTISDNCILPRDVFNTGAAVRALVEHYGNPKPKRKTPDNDHNQHRSVSPRQGEIQAHHPEERRQGDLLRVGPL